MSERPLLGAGLTVSIGLLHEVTLWQGDDTSASLSKKGSADGAGKLNIYIYIHVFECETQNIYICIYI